MTVIDTQDMLEWSDLLSRISVSTKVAPVVELHRHAPDIPIVLDIPVDQPWVTSDSTWPPRSMRNISMLSVIILILNVSQHDVSVIINYQT